jgi:N-acetylmuramoyl-L-alanine amidase
MGVFSDAVARGLRVRRCAVCAVMVSCCLGAAGSRQPRIPVDSWQQAVASRVKFEAEPSHGRLDYASIMTEFRAIYHSNPKDAHAAASIDQVAQLLVEQGRELHDAKSLRDAAGQYEFLVKQYPASPLAAPALAAEVRLFGPDGVDDPAEKKRATAELKRLYPGRAKALLEKPLPESVPAVSPKKPEAPYRPMSPQAKNQYGGPSPSAQDDNEKRATASAGANAGISPLRAARSGRDDKVLVGAAGRDDGLKTVAMRKPMSESPDMGHPILASGQAATARVTGIRHWSTASYTRVAIDLGDEVEYQAVRVEHPDRIFFDLHHAHLAAELVGKSFGVTDDGFLTRIRAAQYSDDVTRVVLDVHEVTDYSAFLLPNPYRLIIDIHGKTGIREQGLGIRDQVSAEAPVPVVRQSGAANDAAVSSLPPMPVTDGSAGFGLPSKTTVNDSKTAGVAPPRVVIPVKPTVAKPVPNTIVSRTGNSGTEVAEVSDQPGKVEATRRPTSAPISERSKEQGLGIREQGLGSKGPKAAAMPAMGAPPTADGETSLMRALGLKIGRIVIDAGHGGHDSGTLGVDGIEEKDVVLDVALRLGKLLHQRMGAEIVYTRADDTFIPLETRTAIANKAQADLFISVHANSSPDASARGVEVYYLNFTSDPEAMQVASRENAVSTQSVHQLSDLVKKIALKDKIDESKELAGDVEGSLYAGLEKGNDGLKDRGVKKAPFVVLIGANMPSILAEISFVTNPDDAEQLRAPEYRERVAESLFNGVARYAAGINGVKTPVVRVAARR